MWSRLRQTAHVFSDHFSYLLRDYTVGAAKRIIYTKPMFKQAFVLSSGFCAALLLTDVTGKFLSTPKIKLTVSDRLVDAINRKVDLRNFDSCEGKLSGHLKYLAADDERRLEDILEEFDVDISFKVSKTDKPEICEECLDRNVEIHLSKN